MIFCLNGELEPFLPIFSIFKAIHGTVSMSSPSLALFLLSARVGCPSYGAPLWLTTPRLTVPTHFHDDPSIWSGLRSFSKKFHAIADSVKFSLAIEIIGSPSKYSRMMLSRRVQPENFFQLVYHASGCRACSSAAKDAPTSAEQTIFLEIDVTEILLWSKYTNINPQPMI